MTKKRIAKGHGSLRNVSHKKSELKLKLRVYVANIDGRGGLKLPQLEARTSDMDLIILNEVNTHPGDESSIALNCKGVALSDGGKATQRKGYGTVVMSKSFDPERDTIVCTHNEHEISAIRREISAGIFMTTIGVYISPNDPIAKVNACFTVLRGLIESHKKDQVLLLAGDFNAPVGSNRFEKLEGIRRNFNGFRIIDGCTRGRNQLDHAYGFYNPSKITMSGVVVDGVSDHSAIVVDINSSTITSLAESWYKKRVVVSGGDTEIIGDQLTNDLSKLTRVEADRLDPSQKSLDNFTEIFSKIVADVRERNTTYKEVMLPEHRNKRTHCRKMRQVQYYLNKVLHATRLLKRDPDCPILRGDLVQKKHAYVSSCRIAAQAAIERSISRLKQYSKANTSLFFKMTGMHLRFDGVAATKSVEELGRLMDAAESNYFLQGDPFDPAELDGLFEKVRKFDICTDPQFIEERIKGLQKVDPFFKEHASVIAEAISAIVSLIKKSELFPSSCKVAILKLLPSRTIFFLEFLPKLLEDIISVALQKAMPPETEGQMAYIKNRSGNLCVAIGLDAVESADEVVINAEWDQTKAFDSSNWGSLCSEYERQAGVGKFIWDYLQDRTYKFVFDVNRGTRFGFSERPMGRGTWPGTILGPALFSTFQATNTAMRSSNPVWLWTGKFSDDCSPLALWTKLLNGQVQNELDSIWEWKVDTHIGIHVTGPKRPFYYVFRKENVPPGSTWDASLKFDTTEFDRKYSKRQLGISVSLFKDDEQSNKYGYRLLWESKRPLSSLCYRLQDMKYLWSTEFMRTCVQAYAIGKLQFASALYWLRATQASIRRARFDYCMALASVVGCNVAEIVGLFNCKSRRVSESCKNYKELCRFLDLPTLRTMAIKDARSLIRQWFLFDGGRFTTRIAPEGPCPSGSIAVMQNSKRVLIDGIVGVQNTLLGDLFNLAISDLNRPYEEYHRAKQQGTLKDMLPDDVDSIKPEWMQCIDLARSQTEKIHMDLGLSPPSETDFMNTFWLMARDRFKVLERYHRVCKRLDVTPVPPARTRGLRRKRNVARSIHGDGIISVAEIPAAKKQKTQNLSCASQCPFRRLRSENKRICWICGYGITQKKCVEFKCCDDGKLSHTVCWRNQTSKDTEIMCCNVIHYFKRTAKEPDYSVVFTDPKSQNCDTSSNSKMEERASEMYCSTCGDMIDPSDVYAKDHLKYQCRRVPCTPLRPGYSPSSLARRMAALGTVKKLTKTRGSLSDRKGIG